MKDITKEFNECESIFKSTFISKIGAISVYSKFREVDYIDEQIIAEEKRLTDFNQLRKLYDKKKY